MGIMPTRRTSMMEERVEVREMVESGEVFSMVDAILCKDDTAPSE